MRCGPVRAGLVLLLLAAGVLVACTSPEDGPFHREVINLRESDYSAADMFSQQIRGRLAAGTPINVGELTATADGPPLAKHRYAQGEGHRSASHDTPVVYREAAPPFGRVVARQVAGRLADLGYNIVPGNGIGRRGEGLLTGQYNRSRGEIYVRLRLFEIGTGNVLAQFDYSMPETREIGDLLISR